MPLAVRYRALREHGRRRSRLRGAVALFAGASFLQALERRCPASQVRYLGLAYIRIDKYSIGLMYMPQHISAIGASTASCAYCDHAHDESRLAAEGGGLAGTGTFAHLTRALRQSDRPMRLLVERDAAQGVPKCFGMVVSPSRDRHRRARLWVVSGLGLGKSEHRAASADERIGLVTHTFYI
jgi:hypothetical protein